MKVEGVNFLYFEKASDNNVTNTIDHNDDFCYFKRNTNGNKRNKKNLFNRTCNNKINY